MPLQWIWHQSTVVKLRMALVTGFQPFLDYRQSTTCGQHHLVQPTTSWMRSGSNSTKEISSFSLSGPYMQAIKIGHQVYLRTNYLRKCIRPHLQIHVHNFGSQTERDLQALSKNFNLGLIAVLFHRTRILFLLQRKENVCCLILFDVFISYFLYHISKSLDVVVFVIFSI